MHPASAGLLAGSLSESEATRRIVLAAGGLALLGVVLLVGTVWWWRSTRAEHPSLGPLEVMSARRWFRASHAERDRLVAQVRPPGAVVGEPARPAPEPVDLSVLAAGAHAGFDDLREIDEMLGLRLPGAPVAAGAAVDPSPVGGAEGGVPDVDVVAVDGPIVDDAPAVGESAVAAAEEIDLRADGIEAANDDGDIVDHTSAIQAPSGSQVERDDEVDDDSIDPLLQRAANPD